MNKTIQYRFMDSGEEVEVCALVERVFTQFVAPDFGSDGIKEFFAFAEPEAMAKRAGPEQILIVAERDGKIAGMIETRSVNHISLLFVEQRGEGIAKELVKLAITECCRRQPHLSIITVNASQYAKPIYQKLGFQPVDSSQTVNGITYIPMASKLSSDV